MTRTDTGGFFTVKTSRGEMIYGSGGNIKKLWGVIVGDVYLTRRKPEHFCRKHKGWGLQACVYDYIRERGVSQVEVEVEGDGTYIGTISSWEAWGIVDVLNPADGRQVFLPKRRFEDKRPFGVKPLGIYDFK